MNNQTENPKKLELENPDTILKKQWYRRKEKEYNQEYYQKNKVKLLADQKIKVSCPKCNRIVIKSNLNKHLKTKLCINTQELNDYIKDNK